MEKGFIENYRIEEGKMMVCGGSVHIHASVLYVNTQNKM